MMSESPIVDKGKKRIGSGWQIEIENLMQDPMFLGGCGWEIR